MDYNIKDIKEKIKNNKSLTIGEVKLLRDLLNIDCEITTFNKINYNNNKPKVFLIQKDFKGELMPLGHFVCMFIGTLDKVEAYNGASTINPENKLYYFDCSDASKPLELHKKYNLSATSQPIQNFYNYIKNYDLDYFNLKLQSKNSENCGISSLLRIMNKDLTNDEYKHYLIKLKKLFKFKSYDDLINNIMLLYLEKF